MGKLITWITKHSKLVLIVLLCLYAATTFYQCGKNRALNREATAKAKEVKELKLDAAKKDKAFKEDFAKKQKEIQELKDQAAQDETKLTGTITKINGIVFRTSKELQSANATITEYKKSLEIAESKLSEWEVYHTKVEALVDTQKKTLLKMDDALAVAQANIDRLTRERDDAIKKAEEMYKLYKKAKGGNVLKYIIVGGIALVVGYSGKALQEKK